MRALLAALADLIDPPGRARRARQRRRIAHLQARYAARLRRLTR
jgi:hypothetical protein